MKKSIFVCFFLFVVCLFYLSVPNVVFGQSLTDLGLKEYERIFQRSDIYDHFPDLLEAFKSSRIQGALNTNVINLFATDPRRFKLFYPAVDDGIIAFMAINEEFQALFFDRTFHAILQNPNKIEELRLAIGALEPIEVDPCEIPPPPLLVPTSLSIVSGYGQEGAPGTQLRSPFVVEVRDQYGNAFPNANVSFRVTPGSGGSVSSTTARTNSIGHIGRAQTTLTLGSSAGVNVVEVTLAGIAASPKVIFTATTLVPPPPEPPPEPEPEPEPEPPMKSPAEHPPVYWIENNAIYYQPPVGQEEMWYTPTDGMLTGGLAVDMEGGRIYWTEKSPWVDGMKKGNGKIRSTNLDDPNVENVETVRQIQAIPYGIAVGSSQKGDRWIYWTHSFEKIQRIKVDGSGFNNSFITDLNSPKHIAFDAEQHRLYWTEGNMERRYRIRSAAANGGHQRGIVGNLGQLGGIAVANGVVYWTEQPGNGQGKVRSINRNSSGLKLLAGLESVPEGIAVDAIGGKVYWTTSMGEIQSAAIAPVVEGNGIRATGIALGGSSSVSSGPAAPSISSVRPEGSVLLANYPNPFNPETWIPYQLSEATDVTVSIYAVNGHLIRTLVLGHQAAGIYQSKSRAAYWDGRNEFGERVASGLYFYTLTAGDFSATRKMLIRK